MRSPDGVVSEHGVPSIGSSNEAVKGCSVCRWIAEGSAGQLPIPLLLRPLRPAVLLVVAAVGEVAVLGLLLALLVASTVGLCRRTVASRREAARTAVAEPTPTHSVVVTFAQVRSLAPPQPAPPQPGSISKSSYMSTSSAPSAADCTACARSLSTKTPLLLPRRSLLFDTVLTSKLYATDG